MFKYIFFFCFILVVSGCGSPVVNNQSGVLESQKVYLISKKLVGYNVSIGNIDKHQIKHSDLMTNTLKVATSGNSNLENSDVLEIKVSEGENLLEVENREGVVLYKNNIYLSPGQNVTINL